MGTRVEQDDDHDPDDDWFDRDVRLFNAEVDALVKLEDFADNLLFHHSLSGGALDTLRLRIHRRETRWPRSSGINDVMADVLSRWIRRGLRLSPAALDITVDGDQMEQPFYFDNAGPCLGRLTKLRLDNLLLRRSIGDLFGTGSLPVLEDLEIRNIKPAWIVSDTLRNLTVVYASSGQGQPDDSPASRRSRRCRMHGSIAAPRLASLRLEFPLAYLASFNFTMEAPCLAQASIRLLDETPQRRSWLDDDDDHDETTVISNLCRLLGFMCNVTSLHLSGFQEMSRTHAVLLEAVLDGPCCVFPNLTSLLLHDCNLGNRLQTLWRFLHNTPALEQLVLQSCKDPYVSESDDEQNLETATMATNLKLVRIVCGDNEMRSKIRRKLPWTTITE